MGLELLGQEHVSGERATEAMNRMNAALRRGEEAVARDYFELSLAWHRLHGFVQECLAPVQQTAVPTFVVTTWFLRDLIQHLSTTADEDITYVTGEAFGNLKTLSRLCPLRLRKQSLVYAEAEVRSCSDVELELMQHGAVVHAMAHSHPGSGSEATRPSGIDLRYLGKIQKHGAHAIGVIITRDGQVRFFTVEKPFRIVVTGNGATQVSEYVFHVALS